MSENRIYDAVIVGAGPGGMFAALEFAESGLDVLVLELGRPYGQRLECPIMDHGLDTCPGSGCGGACHVITGFGGAFTQRSGGTLSMYPAGSHLVNYFPSVTDLKAGYEEALNQWCKFLVGEMTLEGDIRQEKIIAFANKAAQFGGTYKHWRGWKMTREVLNATTFEMEKFIKSKIPVQHGKKIVRVEKGNGIWQVFCEDGAEYAAQTVLFATGRKGNSVVSQILSNIGVSYSMSSIDLGIRIEIDQGIIDDLAHIHPDLKIKYDIDGHEVRTFCFCPGGRMAVFSQDPLDSETHIRMNFLEGFIGLAELSGRSNMSFLHRLTFPNPKQVWDFQRNFEAHYQKVGGQIIAQRYSDLGKQVFRPLPSGHTLNAYRIGSVFNVVPDTSGYKILEAMRRFDAMMKGQVLNDRAILIAPELGNFWPEVVVNHDFMTSQPGLFMAGDALGFTRGALQGCLTGTQAARGMKKYLQSNK